jgi:hypothetical protein
MSQPAVGPLGKSSAEIMKGETKILVLSEADVVECIQLGELLEVLAHGFKALSLGKVINPERPQLDIPQMGYSLSMPAWMEGMNLTVKIVNVFEDMCGRPRRCKKNLLKSSERGRVLTCVRPPMRRSTCRGPVWEFAERVQFNLARSRRVSIIWFSRSRLIDRCAILSVRPSHTLVVRWARGLSRHRRRPIGSAFGHQCPHDARRLVGEGDDHQHGRFAA